MKEGFINVTCYGKWWLEGISTINLRSIETIPCHLFNDTSLSAMYIFFHCQFNELFYT